MPSRVHNGMNRWHVHCDSDGHDEVFIQNEDEDVESTHLRMYPKSHEKLMEVNEEAWLGKKTEEHGDDKVKGQESERPVEAVFRIVEDANEVMRKPVIRNDLT